MSIRPIELNGKRYYIQWEEHSSANLEDFFDFIEEREGRVPDALFHEIQPRTKVKVNGEIYVMGPNLSGMNLDLSDREVNYLRDNRVPVYFPDVPTQIDGVDRYNSARMWGGFLAFSTGLGLVGHGAHEKLKQKYLNSFRFRDRGTKDAEEKDDVGENKQSRRTFLKTGIGLMIGGTIAFPNWLNIPNHYGGEEGIVRRGMRTTGSRIHSLIPTWLAEGRSAVWAKRLDYVDGDVIAITSGAGHGNLERYITNPEVRDSMLNKYQEVIGRIEEPYRSTMGLVNWIDGRPDLQRVEAPILE
jgi:hypothetical protein